MAAAFLVNFLFWTGLPLGAVAFAALLELTGATWAERLRIEAERWRRFLPVSFGLFVILMWRSSAVYPWTHLSPRPAWFTTTFVVTRDALAFLGVYASAFVFCHASERSRARSHGRSATGAAVWFLIMYAYGMSLLSVDLLMSLTPDWNSTLFPAYMFTGNVYAAVVGLAALTTWTRHPNHEKADKAQDLATLLLGLAVFWMYLFWSQFLVVWYGNVTAEVGYIIPRVRPDSVMAWMVLVSCFVLPVILFLSRWGQRPTIVKWVAPLIFFGLWCHEWLLVTPAFSRPGVVPIGLVTAAFTAMFIVSIRSADRPPREGQERP
jgi:hypothetical protein